jgi:hypothetical protein
MKTRFLQRTPVRMVLGTGADAATKCSNMKIQPPDPSSSGNNPLQSFTYFHLEFGQFEQPSGAWISVSREADAGRLKLTPSAAKGLYSSNLPSIHQLLLYQAQSSRHPPPEFPWYFEVEFSTPAVKDSPQQDPVHRHCDAHAHNSSSYRPKVHDNDQLSTTAHL